jgi:hypothetical protein
MKSCSASSRSTWVRYPGGRSGARVMKGKRVDRFLTRTEVSEIGDSGARFAGSSLPLRRRAGATQGCVNVARAQDARSDAALSFAGDRKSRANMRGRGRGVLRATAHFTPPSCPAAQGRANVARGRSRASCASRHSHIRVQHTRAGATLSLKGREGREDDR